VDFILLVIFGLVVDDGMEWHYVSLFGLVKCVWSVMETSGETYSILDKLLQKHL